MGRRVAWAGDGVGEVGWGGEWSGSCVWMEWTSAIHWRRWLFTMVGMLELMVWHVCWMIMVVAVSSVRKLGLMSCIASVLFGRRG